MSDPFNLPKLLLLTILTFVASIMFVVEFRFLDTLKNLRGYRLTYAYCLAIFLISVSFSLFSDSHRIARSLLGGVNRNNGILYYWAVGLMAFILLAQMRDLKSNRQIEKNFLVVGSILAAYGFVQFIGKDFITLSNPFNRIVITLGNPNFSASILAILGIALLSFAFEKLKSKVISPMSVVLLVLSALLAFLSWATESLQGPLIYVFGFWLLLIRQFTFNQNIFKKTAWLMFTLVGVIIALFSFSGQSPLGASFEQYTLKLRFIYASYGLKALVEHPIFGLGADEYLQAFLKYRSPDFINNYGLSTVTDNAHSVPVNIGANFGALAMFMFLILLVIVLLKATHILFFRVNSTVASTILSITSILLILQSLLSIEQIGLGCATWAFGAMLLQEENLEEVKGKLRNHDALRRQNKLADYVREIATIIIAFGFIFTLQFNREDVAWKNIVYLQYTNDSDAAFVLGELRKLTDLTLSEPRKVAPMINNLLKTGDQETTYALVNSSFSSNPGNAVAVELMANVKKYQGLIQEELLLLEKLSNLDPSNYETLFKYGEAAQAAGKKELAKSIFRSVIELAPLSTTAELSQGKLETLMNKN